MKTSQFGRGEIARREGTVLSAYRDSAGVLTIGTGHTSAAGKPEVKPGMKITAWEADQILTRDLAGVEGSVNSLVKVPLNQNEFDALVSFVFNIGGGAFKASTLLKKLNAGDRAGAADQFPLWNKVTVNGRKIAVGGLTVRRRDERSQFLKAVDPIPAPPPIAATPQQPISPTAPVAPLQPGQKPGFFASLISRLFRKGA